MADRAGSKLLEPDECLRLLGSQALGRVVFSHQTLPVVQPVVFVLEGVHVTLAASDGPMLSAAFRRSVVGFQADCIDIDRRSGWSVHAVGQCHVVTDAGEASRLTAQGLPFWGGWGGPSQFVRVRLEMLEGHRLGPTPSKPDTADPRPA